MGVARKQFTFYKSYFDAISELPKKDQSALILAVCAYALYETPPKGLSISASTAFKLIKPTLDSGRKKAESGVLGGQANRKQTASKLQANCKQIASEKEYENEYENEHELDVEVEAEEESSTDTTAATSEAQRLKAIGGLGKDVVFLSEEQMGDLLNRIGFELFNRYVERLATFIIEKNAYVQNHYETILKWHREDAAIKE